METPASGDLLALDAGCEVERITALIREQVTRTLRRRGAVVGLSGGVDSSVAAALCARALGADRVLGILMPDRDSAPESLRLGRALGDQLGIRTVVEDVTPILEAAGCYSRRDAAIRSVVPEYGDGYRSKIVVSAAATPDRFRMFSLVVEAPDGGQRRVRLTAEAYLGIIAATNFKQRARKMVEYYHADRNRFVVVGTPNRLEHDQGFFVKNGDGAADIKPIAHLYKTQVYQLARFLDVPGEIRERPGTSDTFPLEQTQEEFYFAVPYRILDICLYGLERGLPVAEVALHAGITPDQVGQVYREIESKRRAAAYLHSGPLTLTEMSTVQTSY